MMWSLRPHCAPRCSPIVSRNMFFPATIAVGNTYSAISVDAYNKDQVGDFPDLNAGICTTNQPIFSWWVRLCIDSLGGGADA
jgi:hypothetical protein